MPIYAYECTDCGHQFDKLQRLSDPDPVDCPACAHATLRRQLTAPSFRLAGSGWYETDFKKDGDKKRNLADGGGDAGAGSGESKSDAKPAEAKATDSKSSDSKSSDSKSSDSKPAAAPAAKPAESKPAPSAAS
jgi:putative FmdB family regulatory protein